MPNQILIEDLELSSFIGVPEEERASAQRLTVSLMLEPQRDFRALGDSIANAVDYAAVAEFVKALSLARPGICSKRSRTRSPRPSSITFLCAPWKSNFANSSCRDTALWPCASGGKTRLRWLAV